MRVPLPDAFLAAPLAHRGYHDRTRGVIENTLSAMRAACAAGYGIELDVLLSSDGVPMIFHDDDLDRVTQETGPICRRTAAGLSAIRLTGSPDTIPRFAQVLDVVDGAVPLLIEMKDPTATMCETDGRLESAIAQLLRDYAGPAAVMSFNPHSVAHMARLAPNRPRGLTTSGDCHDWRPDLTAETCARLLGIPDYDTTQSSFISHSVRHLAAPRVAELKTQGAAILCWTIKSPAAEAKARKIADNITFEGYPAPFIFS